MPMNKVIFKIWLDAKRSHLKHSEAMDVLYTKEYIKGQLDLLDEIQEDFNLEVALRESEKYTGFTGMGFDDTLLKEAIATIV